MRHICGSRPAIVEKQLPSGKPSTFFAVQLSLLLFGSVPGFFCSFFLLGISHISGFQTAFFAHHWQHTTLFLQHTTLFLLPFLWLSPFDSAVYKQLFPYQAHSGSAVYEQISPPLLWRHSMLLFVASLAQREVNSAFPRMPYALQMSFICCLVLLLPVSSWHSSVLFLVLLVIFSLVCLGMGVP